MLLKERARSGLEKRRELGEHRSWGLASNLLIYKPYFLQSSLMILRKRPMFNQVRVPVGFCSVSKD